MEDWKEKAKDLKFNQKKSWGCVTQELKHLFPDNTDKEVHDMIRSYLRRQSEYKQTESPVRSSVEFKADGSLISDRIIEISDNEEMTPDFLMKAHGLDSSKWEVIAYKNNLWHSQVKGGTRLVMYQSKITVRPKKDAISLEDIDKHFLNLDRKFKPPQIKRIGATGNRMAEVNIADLHLGKLCWQGDTGNNFDYKLARQTYYNIINRICNELKNQDLEHITFVWANDFWNSDTITNTTTAGTPQDVDVRWQKLFDVGVEMLVEGITMLSQIAPVKTFYTASNHDEQTCYYAVKYLDSWFRHDENVTVDTSAMARKYFAYGNTLIGYTHGEKEKGQRLSALMPCEAPELWGQTKYREMHTAHLHSEHATMELNGVIIRRVSSPTATDTWHYMSGYVGAVRKAQTFVYDKENGLLQIINTPVEANNG